MVTGQIPSELVASGQPQCSQLLPSLCPFWMSMCSQIVALLFWAKPDQVGRPSTQRSWGLRFGESAEGPVAQDCEGRQHCRPSTHPMLPVSPGSAGSSWLCVPHSSCLSTTSSGMSNSNSNAMQTPGE